MKILVLITFLNLLGVIITGVDGFLFCLSTLLLLPVLHFTLNIFFQSAFTSYICLVAIITFALIAYKYFVLKEKHVLNFENILSRSQTTIIFIVYFLFFYLLSLKWADFYSIGERMRDLALIGAGIRDPIFIKEPWMSGVGLNYYAYWYRFGNVLSVLLNLKHWETYHILVAFAPSLLAVSAYLLLSKLFLIDKRKSIFLSVVLLLCSNPAGLYYFFLSDANWWYPSRVVNGTIHEFPAWSFLLGDAHPHFLNSAALSLFIYFSYLLIKAKNNIFLLIFACAVLPMLFFQNANLWELPIWLAAVLIFIFILVSRYYLHRKQPVDFSVYLKKYDLNFYISSIAVCFLCVCLYQMQKNFIPIPSKVRFVTGDVHGSKPSEFFLHWGFFLLPIATVLILDAKKSRLFWSVLLLSCLFFNYILPFLVMLLLLSLSRLFEVLKQEISIEKMFSETIVVLAISLLIVPEIIFLDDPYGAEIERMNTFFKISYANWTMMFLASCYLLRSHIRESYIILASFVLFIFFIATVPQRPVGPAQVRGLDFLDRKYPGVKGLVEFLDTKEPATILEAQGPPYSETSLVATLSNFTAYLGWINHLDLLMPERSEETARRKAITDQVYNNEIDCFERRGLLAKEEITHLVVGELEKNSYPDLPKIDLSCLNLSYDNGNYKLFSLFPVK